MLAYQPAHAPASVVSLHEELGEPVLVVPRHAGAFDDRVCASHAIFAWRTVTTVVPQADGRRLHLESYRPTARFPGDRIPPGLGIGDRITRSWDGALFEILSAWREGTGVRCDLVEIGGPRH